VRSNDGEHKLVSADMERAEERVASLTERAVMTWTGGSASRVAAQPFTLMKPVPGWANEVLMEIARDWRSRGLNICRPKIGPSALCLAAPLSVLSPDISGQTKRICPALARCVFDRC
jgi:hypothetical protein